MRRFQGILALVPPCPSANLIYHIPPPFSVL